ncbi:Adaptive-response sensory-kinase SasA [bioreactor metagenome]|uniref:Adaptive-response sensory-kinase SasA n=1 Tax=bioreactor metagenome TaxID=1076179 RepID=A0A645IM15_9ZZZZ
MYNLISNSIKFTADNEIITVNLDYGVNNIIISVCDNGIGMSKECIENVFIGFQRDLHGPYIFGNGLGLKITKAYVEALEGTIDIKSAPGEGTCVTVQFPKRHVYEKSVLLCSFDQLEKQKLRMEFEECIIRNSPGNDNVTLYGF